MDKTTGGEALGYVGVWATLLALLALTAATHFVGLGIWNVVVNLGIASAKTALIVYFFMHLKRAGGLVRLVAIVGPLWLALLVGLSLADYLTRHLPDWPW